MLRPSSAVKVSLRTPPTADAAAVAESLRVALTRDPPSGAVVSLEIHQASSGWVAPELPAWLEAAIEESSVRSFANPPRSFGMGGSIPFVTSIARRYPAAQVVTTGVLGPGSNAHVPDECLHLPTAKAVTSCTAHLIAALAAASASPAPPPRSGE